MSNARYKGFLMTDFLTASALLGLIITLLAVALGGFSRFNQYQWTRQQCVAAATAQLDSLTATGSPIQEQELERLWPHVSVTIDRAAADGPWTGLDHVQVTAAIMQVKVRLTRYIAPRPAVAKGGQL